MAIARRLADHTLTQRCTQVFVAHRRCRGAAKCLHSFHSWLARRRSAASHHRLPNKTVVSSETCLLGQAVPVSYNHRLMDCRMRLLLLQDPLCVHALRLDKAYILDRAESADDAVLMARYDNYDTVLIDAASLPEAGYACLRRLQSAKAKPPLIVLTARSEDNVRALRSGADEAVLHTVSREELQARVMAVVRRHRGHAQAQLEVGNLSICLTTRSAWVGGVRLNVTPREYVILEQLVLHRGLYVTIDMLLSQLYGGLDEPESKVVNVFVCKIRRKLEQAQASCTIVSGWGQGYRIRPEIAPRQAEPFVDAHEPALPASCAPGSHAALVPLD